MLLLLLSACLEDDRVVTDVSVNMTKNTVHIQQIREGVRLDQDSVPADQPVAAWVGKLKEELDAAKATVDGAKSVDVHYAIRDGFVDLVAIVDADLAWLDRSHGLPVQVAHVVDSKNVWGKPVIFAWGGGNSAARSVYAWTGFEHLAMHAPEAGDQSAEGDVHGFVLRKGNGTLHMDENHADGTQSTPWIAGVPGLEQGLRDAGMIGGRP